MFVLPIVLGSVFIIILVLIFTFPIISDFIQQKLPYRANHTLRKTLHLHLNGKFIFYDQLSTAGKERFCNRVAHILNTKSILGMEGVVLKLEQKILVCAAVAQVTFGLRRYLLRKIKVIKIYPDIFYSRSLDAYLKGSTSQKGVLSFSWKHFEEGYFHHNDNINLAIHELGHALKVNLIYGSEFDEAFAVYFHEWHQRGAFLFNEAKDRVDRYFREYGYTNLDEFFSVALECFFERPEELKQVHPEIYAHLCMLLNLDPSNTGSDYSLNSSTPLNFIRSRVEKPGVFSLFPRHRYSAWHWSYSLILLGLFSFPFYLPGLGSVTLFSNAQIFQLLILGLLPGFFLYKKLYVEKVMDLRFYLSFCAMGTGFNFVTLALIANMLTSSINPGKIYTLENVANVHSEENDLLSEKFYEEFIRADAYNQEHRNQNKKMGLKFKAGILGFKVFYGSGLTAVK